MSYNLKLNSISDFQLGDRVYSFHKPAEILKVVEIANNMFIICELEKTNPEIRIQFQFLPVELRKTRLQNPIMIFRIAVTDSDVYFSFIKNELKHPIEYLNFIITVFKPCKQWWVKKKGIESFNDFLGQFLDTDNVSIEASNYLQYLHESFFEENLGFDEVAEIRIDYGGLDNRFIEYKHSEQMVEVIIAGILKTIFSYLEIDDPENLAQHKTTIRNIPT